jgi:hypothetical protein
MKRIVFTVLLLLDLAASCPGQEPDGRGEVALREPAYRGTKASAPIPPELHLKNEGGSDGSGLCVIASVLINGRYQRVPGLEGGKDSELWRTAKGRPGGYYPEKLEKLLQEVMPDEKWTSYTGDDPTVLDTLSRMGLPIGATMNTGALYQYQPIHHMISLIEYRTGGLACVVDNNDPGVYHWMPAAEFARRWIDGGEGWAFAWSRVPTAVQVSVIILSSALLFLASAVLVTGGIVLALPSKVDL